MDWIDIVIIYLSGKTGSYFLIPSFYPLLDYDYRCYNHIVILYCILCYTVCLNKITDVCSSLILSTKCCTLFQYRSCGLEDLEELGCWFWLPGGSKTVRVCQNMLCWMWVCNCMFKVMAIYLAFWTSISIFAHSNEDTILSLTVNVWFF